MKGLILLDKPQGITSFSAVGAIKRKAHEKRVGHTGTLDPMATGVLPVLLGRATALSSLLLDADKKYIAEIKLGITTDTDDITGEILTKCECNINSSELDAVLNNFVGKISQKPPIYSALKKDGVRLYKLAREGKSVEIDTREIEIFSIKKLEDLNEEGIFKIEVHVSKGTYIRSLARDIGEALGCGATLYSLRRTYAGGFDIENCVFLDNLDEENIGEHILSEELAVAYLDAVNVTDNQAKRFCNGGQLGFDRLHIDTTKLSDGQLLRVKCKDLFLGVGFADVERQQIGIKCIINYPEGQER